MSDAGFVLAAYGVIVGGLTAYTIALRRRLRHARVALEARRRGPQTRR